MAICSRLYKLKRKSPIGFATRWHKSAIDPFCYKEINAGRHHQEKKTAPQQPTVTQKSRQTSQVQALGLVADAKFFVVACSGQDLALPGDGTDPVRGIAQGLDQCEVLGGSAEKKQHSMGRPRTENIDGTDFTSKCIPMFDLYECASIWKSKSAQPWTSCQTISDSLPLRLRSKKIT